MRFIKGFTDRVLLIICVTVVVFTACTDDDEKTLGVWQRRSDLDGPVRSGAAAFVIGNKGYVCGGYRSNVQPTRLTDLWVYDITNNYWEQLPSMPSDENDPEGTAAARNGAVGFSIGTKGYITTGYDADNRTYLNDTWEFDTDTETWRRMDDFPGEPRVNAVGFSIGNYAYVGTGSNDDGQYKNFYRFDPTAASGSQWQIVTGFGGLKREGATAFVIDDAAYICCGINDGSGHATDLWRFTPSTGEWTQLRDIIDSSSDDYDDDYTSITRAYAVSFVIDGKAYLVTGDVNGSYRYNYWIYDPVTDLWEGEDLTPFEGTARINAVSFSTGKRGFVLTGSAGTSRLDDVWELDPYTYEED